jgi:hypothetical protein
VRIRRLLEVWLLVLLLPVPSTVRAQSQPLLQDAERALGDALLGHDEGAFVDRLASGRNVKPAAPGGVGGFRFGMTRAEVSTVGDCQPYTNVARTGGLECPNYTFEGRTMNISFIFGSDKLRRIQLWFYEGESESDAREAVGRAIEYLQRTAGSVHSAAMPGKEVTPDAVMSLLNGSPLKPGYVTQFELSTAAGSHREVWFSRVARHQFGYAVMLFADPPRTAPDTMP